jgi:hypothetical protein
MVSFRVVIVRVCENNIPGSTLACVARRAPSPPRSEESMMAFARRDKSWSF